MDAVGCYYASWYVNPGNNALHVRMEGTVGDGWLGIGFTSSTSSDNFDLITGYVVNSTVVIEDRYAMMSSHAPVDPDQTAILGASGRATPDAMQVTFNRSLTSADAKDASLDTPVHIVFARGPFLNNSVVEYSWKNMTTELVDVSKCICKRYIHLMFIGW